jgi:sodium-dependent dicarboxylate transporter 2/3/5
MAITGIVMGIGGLVLSWIMMFGLSKVNFFEDPAEAAAAPAAVTAPAPAAPVYAKPAEVAAPAETIAEPATAAEAAAPVADSAAVAIPADSAAKVVVDSTAK